MNELFHAGLEVQQFMQARDWPFCIIGGLAVIRWGAVRTTQDIDLTLLTRFGEEEQYIRAVLTTFRSRIPEAEVFALRHRVLLVSASNGVAVDLSLAGLPFEEQMVARATSFAYTPDCILITCSAEDLIVLKTFADRTQDWADVEGILMRQGDQLDKEYIFNQLTPLCELKDTPEILARLRQLMKQY